MRSSSLAGDATGGAALKNQPFRFWDSSNHQLINGIASYGWGLQVQLFGLQLHWDFARLTNLQHTLSGVQTLPFQSVNEYAPPTTIGK